MAQTTLHVTGMACGGCEATVSDALADLEGVSGVAADHEGDSVRVDHAESVDSKHLQTVIEDAGYDVVS